MKHCFLVLALLAAAACSKSPSPPDPGTSTELPDAGAPDASSEAGVGGTAGTGPSPDGPYYPDAAEAPAPKPWTAPEVEAVVAPEPGDDWHAHADAALAAFEKMYLPASGTFDAGYRWTFANGVEAVEASYTRTGGENHLDMILGTYEKQKYDQFLNDGGYDDQLWWGHAWLRAYDLTGNAAYLEAVKVIFTDALNGWEPNVCGGGLWWQKEAVYKNAITNELFLLLAASLHNRVAEDEGPGSYLDWANQAWTWFSESGMINAEGLINDGLTDACENNEQTTWTYNQGVILGALVEMYVATGDAAFLDRAHELAAASTALLVDENGILVEPCSESGCNYDQVSFKGLYLRNLARLYDWTHEPSYYDFIVRNARSLWQHARDGENRLGADWSGPFDSAGSTRQSSAMFALSALAVHYSPASPFLRPSGGPTFSHAVGERAGLLGWACDPAICPAPGSMQGGPYVSYLPLGTHRLHLRLAIDQASSVTESLVTFDVFDQQSNLVLASRDVTGTDFVEPGVSQDFTLDYTHAAADGSLEFRVTWNARPGAPRLTVSDVSIDGEQSFSGANLEHECGRLDKSWHWSADRFRDPAACLMTRGPGVRLAAGQYAAHFELAIDELGSDATPLAVVSVVNREENKIVASAELGRQSFVTTLLQTFAVEFQAFEGYHYDFLTEWRAAPASPRLTQRGVHLRRVSTDTAVTLPFDVRGLGPLPSEVSLLGAGEGLDSATIGGQREVFYHSFVFGDAGNNVLQGGGADVAVPAGQYESLELLLFAVDGTLPGQVFTLTYADGTTQTVTRSISDWLSASPQADERIAFNLAHRWSASGYLFGNYHVFHHSLPLDPSKNLQSFRLPASAAIKVLAATLSASQ
jgi:predicted alpha-1,6-mannanase (GH76 family)